MEDYWRSDSFRVRIQWVEFDPEAFKLIYEPYHPRGTHRVYSDTRTIHLLERISKGTLAHEFGHALGFEDHYAYEWDEKNCQIVGSAYQRDLMGNSAYHQVLPRHFLLLDRAYPYRQPRKVRPFAYQVTDVFEAIAVK